MLFNEFERLVNRATGGFMLESEVSDVVRQLKDEKAKIMRVISKMPAGDERRTAFMELHTLMYKLIRSSLVIFPREKFISSSIRWHFLGGFYCWSVFLFSKASTHDKILAGYDAVHQRNNHRVSGAELHGC